MPRQIINTGTVPSDGTGETMRSAMTKANANFAELYESQAAAASQAELDEHLEDTNNPHSVTKAQLGLDQVNNTSDVNKPISSATQAALNTKLDANHASVTNARTPTGGAGGVLGGNYPNPSFAVDMATQAELDALAAAKANVSHTHSDATTGAAGFMSAADKTKLNGIAVNANNYVLPAPGVGTLGGVMRNTGLGGQFVSGIASNGALVFGTPAGGSASITTPNVFYVTSAGNDTTGDGSLGSPYLTAQKAYEVAANLSGYFLINFGVGSFAANVTSWSANIAVAGSGRRQTRLTINSSGTVELNADDSISVDVFALPTNPGANGPALTLWGVVGREVYSTGAVGLGGENGSPETGGGAGSAGGNGGLIVLIGCDVEMVKSIAGAGGQPGLDNGAGTGSPGPEGQRGHVVALRSYIADLLCETYDWGQSNITMISGSQLNDFGANSSAPHRSNFIALP